MEQIYLLVSFLLIVFVVIIWAAIKSKKRKHEKEIQNEHQEQPTEITSEED